MASKCRRVFKSSVELPWDKLIRKGAHERILSACILPKFIGVTTYLSMGGRPIYVSFSCLQKQKVSEREMRGILK